ncbi:MAG: ribonuclease III [Candidatus Saccharimonadales bacterium]
MDIKELQTTLGYKFKNDALLEVALTHRSFINEGDAAEHNERLEFLGDAILELAVTEHLYKNYSEPEGVLTNWRSAVVKTDSLSRVGEELELNKCLKLGRGEANGTKRARKQILANTVEAIIGAIYLDGGFKSAKNFVDSFITVGLPQIIKTGAWQDAKTKLQEMVQEKEGITPTYEVISESGPDHDKTFIMGVYVGKELRGKGRGASKQIAQQAAASNALEKLEN